MENENNPLPQSSAVAEEGDLKTKVVEVLKTCFDPEIPVDIYDLGLIYKIDVDLENKVNIQMTLTSPMCPVAGSLPPEVESKVRNIEGVKEAKVEVIWDPPWTPEKMSEAAKLKLNMM
jgi:FeS assembly SUF system protein